MSVYIYSLPKAGTYFFAELLSQMGLKNTGYHISKEFYQDTKSYDLETNAMRPSATEVNKFFVPVVRNIKADEFAFGHFPLPFNRDIAPMHMQYVCTYRHPKKTLASEFIDFRFRRGDVDWLSKTAIANDQEAFCVYLKEHGSQAHYMIFKNIVLLRHTLNYKLADAKEQKRTIFCNFEKFLKDSKQYARLAKFLGKELNQEQAHALHESVLNVETKTKATELEIDRESLWSERALEIYNESPFPEAVGLAEAEGLVF